METLSNPYNFSSPLHPVEDRLVCIPRERHVDKIYNTVSRGSFWYITGPAHVGKSTLMNLVRARIGRDHHVIDMDLSHGDYHDKNIIYRRMIDGILNAVPPDNIKRIPRRGRQAATGLDFFEFLKRLRFKNGKKVIFLLDEIGELPYLKEFLALWRKIYTERFDKRELNSYIMVAAGSGNLIKETVGPNSPFNVAEIVVVEDFSEDHTRHLIFEPLKHLGLEIDPGAVEKIWFELQGHPQLTQHLLYLCTAEALEHQKTITVHLVEQKLEQMLQTSMCLDTLKRDVKNDPGLENLLTAIMAGEDKRFLPNKDYAVAGAGAIKEAPFEKNKIPMCIFRNHFFKKFLQGLLAQLRGAHMTQKSTIKEIA